MDDSSECGLICADPDRRSLQAPLDEPGKHGLKGADADVTALGGGKSKQLTSAGSASQASEVSENSPKLRPGAGPPREEPAVADPTRVGDAALTTGDEDGDEETDSPTVVTTESAISDKPDGNNNDGSTQQTPQQPPPTMTLEVANDATAASSSGNDEESDQVSHATAQLDETSAGSPPPATGVDDKSGAGQQEITEARENCDGDESQPAERDPQADEQAGLPSASPSHLDGVQGRSDASERNLLRSGNEATPSDRREQSVAAARGMIPELGTSYRGDAPSGSVSGRCGGKKQLENEAQRLIYGYGNQYQMKSRVSEETYAAVREKLQLKLHPELPQSGEEEALSLLPLYPRQTASIPPFIRQWHRMSGRLALYDYLASNDRGPSMVRGRRVWTVYVTNEHVETAAMLIADGLSVEELPLLHG